MRDFPDNIDSKYRFITIAAQRCDLLQKGAKPKIELSDAVKFTTLAMEEVLDGLVEFEIGEQSKKLMAQEAGDNKVKPKKKPAKKKPAEKAKAATKPDVPAEDEADATKA